MDWWVILSLFLGLLLLFLLSGMPVAFAFLVTNFAMVGLVFGLESGLNQLVRSMYDSVARFTFTPIPAFILLGELLFRSGLAFAALDVLSQFLGRLPGRLAVLAVGSGTLFAALSGSNIANTSMLGALLVPDMRRRGYHVSMSVGPIMAAGTLAMLIPPSAVAVLLGGIGKISVGALLIGGIIPGLLMALLFVVYIIAACALRPGLAPAYEVNLLPWSARFAGLVKHVLPLFAIIFLVVGLIFAGWATPTESAALGTLGAFVLVALYGRLTKDVLLATAKGTLKISGMIMFIFACAAGFSQLLAFTGATRELIAIVATFDISATAIIIVMLTIVLILGGFLEQTSIMMITLPLFMPIVLTHEINPVWFGIMMLIMLDLGNLTPPFGFNLFIMKGVVSRDVTMQQIYRAALPFILLELGIVALILALPDLVLWLPRVSGL